MKKLFLILFLALAVPVTQVRADIAANAARDVYTGNNSTTAYSFTFKVLTASDIAVYVNGTLQTLATHYTLSGVGNDNGGTVTFVSAPALNAQVLFLRNQPVEQTSSYVTGAVSPSQIERDFDRQTAINQQQNEEISRSLRFPRTMTPNSTMTEVPALMANKCLQVNSGATGWELDDCGAGGGGEPSGSDTQVQFNDGGAFGGDAGMVFNKTTNVLTVSGDVIVGSQSVCLEDGTNCPASSGDDQTAAEVPFTPAGNIAATDTQAAIEELDAEKQPIDADLTCLAGLSSAGMLARTGAGTCAERTITGTSEQVTVTNGPGTAGNPTLSLPSTITLPGNLQFTVSTPAQITSDQNNYALGTATFYRLSTDASRTITGFSAPSGFKFAFIANVGAQDLVLAHESGSSTASNRITSVSGASITIPAGAMAMLNYDLTSTRWRAADMRGALTAEADTLDSVFDRGKTIDGATSFANAFRVTDSSGDGVAIYRSAGTGPVVTCIIAGVENDCDKIQKLNTGKKFAVQNNAGTDLVTVDQANGMTKAYGLVGGFSIPVARDGGLLDTDDFAAIVRIPYAQTITQVCGRTDTGTTTLNLQRDDGSAANILSSNLTAATTEACTTSFSGSEATLSEGHYINLVIVTAAASGAPTKVTVSVKTRRD